MSRVDWTPERFIARLTDAANGAVKAGAEVAADTARRGMGGGSSFKGSGHSRQTFGSSPPGGYPGVRTGHLRRSIVAIGPSATGKPLTASYGSSVFYARTHEFGAVIRPKNGKLLAVPLSGLAQSLYIRHGGNVRNIPGLRLVKGKKNLLLVLDRKGRGPLNRGARSEILFALVPRVVIPARPWAMRSARESRGRMLDVMRAEFRSKLTGAVVT